MDFSDQMQRYFGSDRLDAITPAALTAGIEQMQVDLGLESDRGYRFSLWTLLWTLGAAPDLDIAFSDPADRDAARSFMALMEGSE